MINNRQSSRRRGRGGNSQRSSGGGQGQRDSGNRIDSRTRGNAAQLLEKYKNMARDAQMQGDRVQTEYYLQFADHYFRVLADSRARSDDHRPIRPVDDFDGSDEEYGDEGEPIRAGEQQGDQRHDNRDGNRIEVRGDGRRDERDQRRDPRRDDRPRRDDQPRERQYRDAQPREDRGDEAGTQPVREDAPRLVHSAPANGAARPDVANDIDDAEPAAAKPARKPRTRKAAVQPAPEGEPMMEADRLPPALAPAPVAQDGGDEDAPKPRRRRTRSEAQAG